MNGPELRAIRKRLGWTQTRLADVVGVAWNTVARWERDEVTIREPMARFIQRIAVEHGASTKPTTRKEGKKMARKQPRKKGGP